MTPLPQLRPYQIDIAHAVLASVIHRQGLTFSVEISRQGGKNELSSQIELLLLTRAMATGGDAIKAAPTFRPQCLISMARLRDRIHQAGLKKAMGMHHGYGITLGRARALFLSAEPGSQVVGHTASLLLEIDEAQDVDSERFNKDFKPMGASTNVTTVLWGTPWDDFSLLEQTKQANLQAQAHDGIQRHFAYDWQEVAKYNPAYAAYVQAERGRLGPDHPLFLTQYCLQPIGRTGRLFNQTQLLQLHGDHPPTDHPSAVTGQQTPTPSTLHPTPYTLFVAGLDIAGADEDTDDPTTPDTARKRDSTVLTIAQITFPQDPLFRSQPLIRIIAHFADVGTKHALLYPQLLDLLRSWRVKRCTVDATGIGAGVSS